LATTLADIGLRDLGGLTVEIAHFGPAHTQSDLIVALPQPQVVFAGDLVETAGPPQFDDSSSVEGWVKTLDALYALLKPALLVVPGHGPIVDGGEVGRQRAGMTMLWGQAEWACLQGLAEADVYESEGLTWPWDEATVRQGIALAYRELRAKPPRPAQPGPPFWG
jgi:glyoxylase-like metal-dependent hydrolase (beta-lactamase superfamily II)